MATSVMIAGGTALVGDCAARAAGFVVGDADMPGGADVSRGAVRTASFSGVTALLVGVGGEVWYRTLLRKFPEWSYHVALRTVIDQVVFSPVALMLTVSAVTFLETWDREATGLRLRDDWLHHIGKMWWIWGFGTSLSYFWVPTPWQPVVMLGQACIWTGFISYRIHRPLRDNQSDHEVGGYLREERHVERTMRLE